MALNLQIFSQFNTKINMAMTEGFEPSTPRAEIWCSIQLSYVTTYSKDITFFFIGQIDFIKALNLERIICNNLQDTFVNQ